MQFYIFIMMITVFGITNRFHRLLFSMFASVQTRRNVPPAALVLWLIILCICAVKEVRADASVLFLSAFIGLLVYGIIMGQGFTSCRSSLLYQEQMTTLRLFFLALILNLIRQV
jgi:hypothetical protein